jgi:hypothetical protein
MRPVYVPPRWYDFVPALAAILSSSALWRRFALPSDADKQIPAGWRTPMAIALAVAVGVLVGIFLYASAVPFGPVLLGWLIALAGAVVVSAGLSILATGRFFLVGLGYATGVAVAAVVAGLVAPRGTPDWWDPPLQFLIVFGVVGIPALLGSWVCALLKWEDQRVRQNAQ